MNNFTAYWSPAWYALDQKIRAGAASKFLFTRTEPRQFFNGLGDPAATESLYVRIVSIAHPVLGNIEEIDTLGLSYRIWLDNNELVQVDAEERPGHIESTTLKDLPSINSFDLVIELEPALPSQTGELDMVAVMLNDDTNFFKWWDVSLEEANDIEAVLGAFVHYIHSLLKDKAANGQELRNVFRFIGKMYAWGNPYIGTMFDENVLVPMLKLNDAGEWLQDAGDEAMRRSALLKARSR